MYQQDRSSRSRLLCVALGVSAFVLTASVSSSSGLALTAGPMAESASRSTPPPSSPNSEGGTIAFLLPENQTARYEQLDTPFFTEALTEYCPDCELIIANADGDAAKQQQQAEDAITNGADVLVIIPVDANASTGIVENAKRSDVSVVSYGRMIANADIDAAVAFDARQAGVEQATALADALAEAGHPSGPIVAINGSPADPNVAVIKEGAQGVFEERGIEIAAEFDTPDWSPDKAQLEMDQAITQLGSDGFYGVYSMNDGMAGGIIASLRNAGIDPSERPITGLDADLGGVQRIISGDQYMSVFQDIQSEADAAARFAVDLLRGDELTADLVSTTVDNGKVEVPTHFFRIAAVTADNLQSELFDPGYYSAADVCTGEYAAACAELGIK